ncbi:MAG: ribbon-helix-helix protein, CopG family [Gemmatimonadetes bacterium]|nr:ribbon-helix-helix protein, CopG family [Gemmatimonadota bacterium]
MKDQLTFRIPRELARALARTARARGVPRSQLVREALAEYLPAQENPSPPGATAWERVRHFAGSLPMDRAAIEADELAARLRRHNWRE